MDLKVHEERLKKHLTWRLQGGLLLDEISTKRGPSTAGRCCYSTHDLVEVPGKEVEVVVEWVVVVVVESVVREKESFPSCDFPSFLLLLPQASREF